MSYEETTPAADKWLLADGSVTTMAGEVILPADPDRAAEYAARSPAAAKWLLPDGSILDKLPVSGEGTVSVGAITAGGAVPDASFGRLGDVYVTADGIYIKKLIQAVGAGFMLTCSNPAYNGFWVDMGVNTAMSSSGGNPQGSHYYRHESGLHFLCWNTAYGGYWWINTNLTYDNGSAAAWCTATTYTPDPPSAGWGGAVSGTLTWTKIEPDAPPQPGWERCLYVGEPLYTVLSPEGTTQALAISIYKNFKIELSTATIALSFSGTPPTGDYPYTVRVWLIPKAGITGAPKHTVTWPSSVSWVNTNAHKKIGTTGQPDTPVLVELTTFDNGAKWIGRAYNALYPAQEV